MYNSIEQLWLTLPLLLHRAFLRQLIHYAKTNALLYCNSLKSLHCSKLSKLSKLWLNTGTVRETRAGFRHFWAQRKIYLGVLPMCSHELTMQIENKMQIRIVNMKYNEAFWGLTFIIVFILQDQQVRRCRWTSSRYRQRTHHINL
jgi:hypothetical protein